MMANELLMLKKLNIARPSIVNFLQIVEGLMTCRPIFQGCLDSMECGTVEWNSGTVE